MSKLQNIIIMNSRDISVTCSVPGKRGVSGQKPKKAGHLTQQNGWET